jgi:hypothetical protein
VVDDLVKNRPRRPASRKPTARLWKNQAVLEAVDKAVALEERKRPFSISGRGHEPRRGDNLSCRLGSAGRLCQPVINWSRMQVPLMR